MPDETNPMGDVLEVAPSPETGAATASLQIESQLPSTATGVAGASPSPAGDKSPGVDLLAFLPAGTSPAVDVHGQSLEVEPFGSSRGPLMPIGGAAPVVDVHGQVLPAGTSRIVDAHGAPVDGQDFESSQGTLMPASGSASVVDVHGQSVLPAPRSRIVDAHGKPLDGQPFESSQGTLMPAGGSASVVDVHGRPLEYQPSGERQVAAVYTPTPVVIVSDVTDHQSITQSNVVPGHTSLDGETSLQTAAEAISLPGRGVSMPLFDAGDSRDAACLIKGAEVHPDRWENRDGTVWVDNITTNTPTNLEQLVAVIRCAERWGAVVRAKGWSWSYSDAVAGPSHRTHIVDTRSLHRTLGATFPTVEETRSKLLGPALSDTFKNVIPGALRTLPTTTFILPKGSSIPQASKPSGLYHVEAGIRIRELYYRLDHYPMVSNAFADGYFGWEDGRWWWFNMNPADNRSSPQQARHGGGFRHYLVDTGFPDSFKKLDQHRVGFTWHVSAYYNWAVTFTNLAPGASWALPTLGGSGGQTLGGAISTGTHGGDQHEKALTDIVRAVHLVGPGGFQYWIEPKIGAITDEIALRKALGPEVTIIYDDEMFNAVVVSMGCMGIIYSLVIEVVPQFGLRQTRRMIAWKIHKKELEIARRDPSIHYVGALLSPYETILSFTNPNWGTISLNDNPCWLTTRRRLDYIPEPANYPKPKGGHQIFGVEDVKRQLNLSQDATPRTIFQVVSAFWLDCFNMDDVSYKIMDTYPYDDEFNNGAPPIYSLELCFPSFQAGMQFVDFLLADFFPRHRRRFLPESPKGVFLGGILPLRFHGRSKALLSPTSQSDDNFWVEAYGVKGVGSSPSLLEDLEKIAIRPPHDAFVHWGQHRFADEMAIKARYGSRLAAWRRKRAELITRYKLSLRLAGRPDPYGDDRCVFDNAFARRLGLCPS